MDWAGTGRREPTIATCTHPDEQSLAACWVWEAGYPPSSLAIPVAMVMVMMMLLDKAILKLIFFFFWDVT